MYLCLSRLYAFALSWFWPSARNALSASAPIRPGRGKANVMNQSVFFRITHACLEKCGLLGSLAAAAVYRQQLDRGWTWLVRQRETQVGSSEHLARFAIEWQVNHIFAAHQLQFCHIYVNAQVPASVNVVESVRSIICGYVYLVYMYARYTQIHPLDI